MSIIIYIFYMTHNIQLNYDWNYVNSRNELSHIWTFISTQMHDINTWIHVGQITIFINHSFFQWLLQLSPTTFLLLNAFSLSFSLVISLTFSWFFHHFFFVVIFFTLLTFFTVYIKFQIPHLPHLLQINIWHPPLNYCIASNGLL
jgi:hypothetical protein